MSSALTFHTLIAALSLSCVLTADIPNCPYEDTVDITTSKRFDNGSYAYAGLIVPAVLTGTYDYELLHDGERKEVPQHLRACICQLKACVKFCCPPNQFLDAETGKCKQEAGNLGNYDARISIYRKNSNKPDLKEIRSSYVIQEGIPCAGGMYALEPQKYSEDEYRLFENGTLLRVYDETYLTKRDYCLSLHRSNVSDSFALTPMNCYLVGEMPLTQKITYSAMLISVPFFIFTIIYLLRKTPLLTREKSLVSYLASLAVGYSLMTIISLTNFEISPTLCQFMGYSTYYILLAAFFWLSTISFELWRNNKSSEHIEKSSITSYAFCAWLCPFVLVLLAMLAQQSDLSEALKPGIGDQCWLKINDWSAMLYFYGPISALIMFNIVMYILTVFNIHQHAQQPISFRVYSLLFILMGISWSLEITSYLVGTSSAFTDLFFISDLYNALQGIVIFIIIIFQCENHIFSDKTYFYTNLMSSWRHSKSFPCEVVNLAHKSINHKNCNLKKPEPFSA